MPAQKHVHKYRRVKVAGNNVYACSLPTCTHYMPKHLETMLEGKATKCWGCDKVFYLDDIALSMEFPSCLTCRASEVDLITLVNSRQA